MSALSYVKSFIGSSLRLAFALFVAVVGVLIIVEIYTKSSDLLREKKYMKFEEARDWNDDLSMIGFKAKTKTKVIGGTLFARIYLEGYPQFLTNPTLVEKNKESTLFVEFIDKDGFVIFSNEILLSEFSVKIDDKLKPIGLLNQFQQSVDPEEYARVASISLKWNFDTEIPTEKAPVAAVARPAVRTYLDHCAPAISREERLRRLALHGIVRQIYSNTYAVGARQLEFYSDGAILACR